MELKFVQFSIFWKLVKENSEPYTATNKTWQRKILKLSHVCGKGGRQIMNLTNIKPRSDTVLSTKMVMNTFCRLYCLAGY